MIPRIAPLCQTPSWQKHDNNAICCPEELLKQLMLPDGLLAAAKESAKLFPLKVTHSYLARIEKGNVHDPLLRQILPLVDEQYGHPDYSTDPVGDLSSTPVPGLLHKYKGRVLLMATASCGIHCRYCFRRHFPYSEHKSSNNWRQAIEYIRKDHSIHEVILSGGDPLLVSDSYLNEFINKIEAISHIKRLRIHTRLPVVIPQRLTENLMDILKKSRLNASIVVHINHPNELDQELGRRLQIFTQAGITILNQSVLLKAVNNNAQTLIALSEKLFQYQVMPYYLHLLDPIEGAAHLEVSKEMALKLLKDITSHIPGYLVPKLSKEEPHKSSKTILI